MKKLIITVISFSFLLVQCNKETYFDGDNYINEDFESVTNSTTLIEQENWTYYQNTEANSTMEIDTTKAIFGDQCLKLTAAQGEISKSDIANNDLAFWEKDIIQFTGWFYLDDTLDLDYVFLCDIEEGVAIGSGPGIRIAINESDYLVIERNKYGESTLIQPAQTAVIFPRKEWVKLELEIELSQKKKGYIKLKQNDVLIIQEDNIQTLPKDNLYFIQGTKGMYQSLQVGLTAITANRAVDLYIDNITIQTIN